MNKKGFTLIELLAVIIILGILMIIAIPSVTRYISDSRKNAYVDTAKEVIGSARNLVNSGSLGMYSTNTTYYIPVECIKTENALKSPYGDFIEGGAYVGVIYDGKGYTYYWISVDDAGQGVRNITRLDKLDTDDIESDLKKSDITDVVEKTGIGNRTEINILKCSNNTWDPIMLSNTNNNISEDGGKLSEIVRCIGDDCICKRAKTLHTATCQNNSTGCSTSIGSGNTITYGTIPNGTLKAGDAYDCKVTQNGGYTERFYYVTSDGENSVFIYNKNMNDPTTYSYDADNRSRFGPRTAYQYLPSLDDWNNPKIIAPGSKQLLNEKGENKCGSYQLSNFSYTNKAARLLTTQELVIACPSMPALGSSNTAGQLDQCNWLLENIGMYEKNSGSGGYWLETPDSSGVTHAWNIGGLGRIATNSILVYNTAPFGVRPVITVKTDYVE